MANVEATYVPQAEVPDLRPSGEIAAPAGLFAPGLFPSSGKKTAIKPDFRA
jgi:hypothetical protein